MERLWFDTICTAACVRCDSSTACRQCRLESSQSQSLSSSQITSRNAKPTQHIEITRTHNVNSKLAFHRVVSFQISHTVHTFTTYQYKHTRHSSRRVHCIICAVFSDVRPHSHVTSPSKYPHFCLCSLLHVKHVRSLCIHLHGVHGLSYPLARLLLSLAVTLCGVVCNIRNHSLHRMTIGDLTLCKKLFLDSSLFYLQGVLYIESEPHWFHVWSFPFLHIHLSGCRVTQFQLANTDLLHWLVAGIL